MSSNPHRSRAIRPYRSDNPAYESWPQPTYPERAPVSAYYRDEPLDADWRYESTPDPRYPGYATDARAVKAARVRALSDPLGAKGFRQTRGRVASERGARMRVFLTSIATFATCFGLIVYNNGRVSGDDSASAALPVSTTVSSSGPSGEDSSDQVLALVATPKATATATSTSEPKPTKTPTPEPTATSTPKPKKTKTPTPEPTEEVVEEAPVVEEAVVEEAPVVVEQPVEQAPPPSNGRSGSS